jgi:hypothetical protein
MSMLLRILRDERFDMIALVVALMGVGLMGVSFTDIPFLSGMAGIVGCLIAGTALVLLLYRTIRAIQARW